MCPELSLTVTGTYTKLTLTLIVPNCFRSAVRPLGLCDWTIGAGVEEAAGGASLRTFLGAGGALSGNWPGCGLFGWGASGTPCWAITDDPSKTSRHANWLIPYLKPTI